MRHPAEEAIAAICQGLRDFRATGAELVQPYFLSLLAEAYGQDRQIEEGLAVLAEVLMLVEKNGECWYEAELRRLKGGLLLQQSPDNHAEAESCFHQAISIAQNQLYDRFEASRGVFKRSKTRELFWWPQPQELGRKRPAQGVRQRVPCSTNHAVSPA